MDWEMKARMLAQAVEEVSFMLGAAGACVIWWADNGWAIAGGVACVLVAANGLFNARIAS